MRPFIPSLIVTLVALIAAFFWAGSEGLYICGLLIVLEISFSFDNAVVNATVLRHMDRKWQRRFLTWGMPISIVGMYYLFPILIVSFATGINVIDVMHMVINAPEQYAHNLAKSHVRIASFGGMFLLMVFLKFIMDENKNTHWLGFVEKKLSQLGKLNTIEAVIALIVLLILQGFLHKGERQQALAAGVFGVILYIGVHSITALCGVKKSSGVVNYSGILGFIYLNMLDASFSLDAVIGSFAISRDIVIVVLGLSAGAMFVRSLTIHMVRTGMLSRYIYLEHGAHYGIGALAIIMLASLFVEVPESVAGLTGIVFILLALASSVQHNKIKR